MDVPWYPVVWYNMCLMKCIHYDKCSDLLFPQNTCSVASHLLSAYQLFLVDKGN